MSTAYDKLALCYRVDSKPPATAAAHYHAAEGGCVDTFTAQPKDTFTLVQHQWWRTNVSMLTVSWWSRIAGRRGRNVHTMIQSLHTTVNSIHYRNNTHTCLTALFPGLPRWAGTRIVKPIWILLKQVTVSGSGISWAVCKSAPSLQTDNQATTQFLQAGRPSCPPNQQHRSIEGILAGKL